jgi:hypothetical protein
MLMFFVLGFLTLPLAVMIEPQVLTSMPTLLVVFGFIAGSMHVRIVNFI